MEQAGPALPARRGSDVRVRERRPPLSLYPHPCHPLEAVGLNELAGLIGLVAFVPYRHGDDLGSFLEAPRGAYTYFVGCGVRSALALFALFAALERERVVVDPLSNPTSLFAILVTALFFGRTESITRQLVLGAVLIVTGAVLITGLRVLVL
jgi:uncharacterized membrane protein